MTEKQLLEMEAALLGACILNSAHTPLLYETLPRLSQRHKTLATALIATANGQNVADMALVRSHLGPKWDEIGGHAYIATLTDGILAGHAQHYYDELRAMHTRLEALEHVSAARTMLADGDHPGMALDLLEAAKHALSDSAKPIEPLDLASIVDAPQADPPWIIPGWMAASDRIVFGAQPGFGKSYVLLDLALALTSGQPFLGIDVAKTQRVTIIDEENPIVQNQRRLQHLMRGRGIGREEAAELPLRVFVKNNIRSDAAGELRRELDRNPTDWLFFDSLIRFLGGRNESASQDIAEWFSTFLTPIEADYDVKILMLHHIRKPRQGPFGQESDPLWALRGSGDIAGWPDCVWMGVKDGRARSLEIAKSRWLVGESAPKLHLELEENAGASTLVATEEAESAAVFVGARLNRVAEQGILRQDLIEDYAESIGCGNDAASKAVSRALSEMRRRGTVRQEKEGRATRYYMDGA
jgi:hypothetical protein